MHAFMHAARHAVMRAARHAEMRAARHAVVRTAMHPRSNAHIHARVHARSNACSNAHSNVLSYAHNNARSNAHCTASWQSSCDLYGMLCAVMHVEFLDTPMVSQKRDRLRQFSSVPCDASLTCPACIAELVPPCTQHKRTWTDTPGPTGPFPLTRSYPCTMTPTPACMHCCTSAPTEYTHTHTHTQPYLDGHSWR
eukprot:1158108-Pelagomonas_calceolata.AAC.6